MENVIGILSKKTESGENVIDIIMEKLNKNYNCIINKLYASDFEVPQNRRRTIIIGVRKDLNIVPTEPEKIIKSIHERIPVKNILIQKEDVEPKYYLSEKALTGIKNKREANIKKVQVLVLKCWILKNRHSQFQQDIGRMAMMPW